MRRDGFDYGIQAYESYLSILYKMMRARYTGRRGLLSEYGESEKNHFLPFSIPRWLRLVVVTPDEHLPITYCPYRSVLNAREIIKYCSECMGAGYHSVFFMLDGLDWCMIHNRRLQSMCSECRKRFIGDVSIDVYFDCPISIGRLDVYCGICGINWPNLSEVSSCKLNGWIDDGAISKLKHQANWYFSIAQGAAQSSSLCKTYFCDRSAKDSAVAPLEARFNLTSPDPDDAARKGSRVRWIRFVNILPAHALTASCYFNFRKLVSQYCEEIKDKYLAGHEACYLRINALTEYMPLRHGRAPFCLCALSYVLFRLKLACDIWPTPTSVSAGKSCFDNLFSHIDSGVKPAELRKLLLFLFLKIMGEVQYLFVKGRSTTILLRGKTMDADFFFIRTTSYSLRHGSCFDFDMESSSWVSTRRDAGNLSIMWAHDQSSSEKFAYI